ncbi:MAG: hypothetical protein JWN73_3856 [Betaproteobacteria bacterium]|nr:hypothetical protein [Betaproteobacteria bacterium]
MQARSISARSAVFLVVALGVAVFGGMFFFHHFFATTPSAECEVYPLQLMLSPSGRRQARQEQEACGGSEEVRTRVLVGDGSAAPVTAFEVVSSKALGSMSVGQRALPLTLRWQGEDRLLIIHPAGVASQLPAGSYGGVEVRLQAATAGGR